MVGNPGNRGNSYEHDFPPGCESPFHRLSLSLCFKSPANRVSTTLGLANGITGPEAITEIFLFERLDWSFLP